MDPICHTLVGAALGEAGLKRRSALGMATVLIGANLPDIDGLAIPLGYGLVFRRGWTHGILALVVLPFVLTALMLAYDRFVRRRRHPSLEPARAGPLLWLSALSILTHPTLDFMNDYGMRWLMPFADRWFYGDALFIVDPWMWLALGLGVYLTRRWVRRGDGRARRPARWAVGFVTIYVAAMLALSVAGRHVVARALAAQGFERAQPLLVGPEPVNPFHKRVVFADGDRYRFGTLTWRPAPRFVLEERVIETRGAHPAARAAAATPAGRAFLSWSRFPFFVIEEDAGETVVRLADARYTRFGDSSWAMVVVRLPAGYQAPGGP